MNEERREENGWEQSQEAQPTGGQPEQPVPAEALEQEEPPCQEEPRPEDQEEIARAREPMGAERLSIAFSIFCVNSSII